MALYEFDDKNIYDSWAIDKNGYHKHPYEGGSSSGSVFEENVYFGGEINSEDYKRVVTVFINELAHQHLFGNGSSFNSVYLYFGDEIPNEELVIDENYYINDDRLTLLNGTPNGYNFPIGSDIYRIYTNDLDTEIYPYPENWKELQAHVVFVVSYQDGRIIEHDILQIHQKK